MSDQMDYLEQLDDEFFALIKMRGMTKSFLEKYFKECEEALRSEDASVREKAALMLNLTFDPYAVKVFIRNFHLLGDMELMHALSIFSHHKSREALDLVLGLLEHPAVSFTAVKTLFDIVEVGDEKTIECLNEKLESAQEYLKCEIIQCIEFIKTGKCEDRDRFNRVAQNIPENIRNKIMSGEYSNEEALIIFKAYQKNHDYLSDWKENVKGFHNSDNSSFN